MLKSTNIYTCVCVCVFRCHSFSYYKIIISKNDLVGILICRSCRNPVCLKGLSSHAGSFSPKGQECDLLQKSDKIKHSINSHSHLHVAVQIRKNKWQSSSLCNLVFFMHVRQMLKGLYCLCIFFSSGFGIFPIDQTSNYLPWVQDIRLTIYMIWFISHGREILYILGL